MRRPALSQRLHREALADAADPVAALLASCCSYPRREGYVWVSRKTLHKRRSLSHWFRNFKLKIADLQSSNCPLAMPNPSATFNLQLSS